jgi:hypothetical protein
MDSTAVRLAKFRLLMVRLSKIWLRRDIFDGTSGSLEGSLIWRKCFRVQWAPLNGIMDNGINWFMGSYLS